MANISSGLYSLELEQQILSTLLQHPDTYVQISYINSKDFSRVNSPIFSVIQQIIESKGRPDAVVVSERLKSAGITIDGIDVGEYVSTLVNLRSVDPKNVVELAGELKKKTLIRTINENCDKLKREVNQNSEKSGREIISSVDKYLGDSLIDMTGGESTGTNMMEVIPDMIEEMGNEPDTIPGIRPPYESMFQAHGFWKPGSISFFVARRAMGKSLLKLDICRKVNLCNDRPIHVLLLDSELSLRDQVIRFVCGNIGAPYHLIDNHQWRKDTEWCPKIRAELDRIRNEKNKNIWFEAIGNMGGAEMMTFIKKFYLKNVGKNDAYKGSSPFLIIYDYFKMTNADDKSDAEYLAAYAKSEMLKDVAEYCKCPIISSIQANREGITGGRESHSDTAACVSLSDRLGWLPSYMGIWRKRTHEEMIDDSSPTEMASSHKLIDIKKRYFGPGGVEFDKAIRVKNGKNFNYVQNYINFEVSGFDVQDKGTLGQFLQRAGRTALEIPKQDNSQPGIL